MILSPLARATNSQELANLPVVCLPSAHRPAAKEGAPARWENHRLSCITQRPRSSGAAHHSPGHHHGESATVPRRERGSQLVIKALQNQPPCCQEIGSLSGGASSEQAGSRQNSVAGEGKLHRLHWNGRNLGAPLNPLRSGRLAGPSRAVDMAVEPKAVTGWVHHPGASASIGDPATK